MFGKKSATVWGNYDTVLCDLDGVIYEGTDAIVDSVETVNAFIAKGIPVGYVTNNSSRKPETTDSGRRQSFGGWWRGLAVTRD
jgi:ribonucleotide monophosphatase NagD (HAD superfamily)